MAKSKLPPDKRSQTPCPLEALNMRHDLGHALLVIAVQLALIVTVLMICLAKDLSYAPSGTHPIAFYFLLVLGIVVVFGIAGSVLRGKTPRIN